MDSIPSSLVNTPLNISDLRSIIGNEDISTIEGIERACTFISHKEKEVTEQLETVVSRQSLIESKLTALCRSMHILQTVENDATQLSERISQTATLAESVSAKVRRLDEARSRVSECQQRVHDLIDLQLCSQGVMTAIREEDYEKGAGHVSRYLSMDQNLLQRTADDVTGSVTSVSKALQTLEEATKKMREIIHQKFDEAVRKDDLASVERFFKIFPLLGLHREGIAKFSSYICQKLEVKAQKDLRTSMDVAKAEKRMAVAFADTLTTILENFARVFKVNQPIIESCFGNGYLLQMYEIIQLECDREVKNVILEFNKNRQVNKRTGQINDYMKSGGGSGAASLGHFRKPSGSSADKLNPKDIDAVIGEITIMHSRVELYFRFMRRRVLADLEGSSLEEDVKKEKMNRLESVVTKSDLSRQMQELLGTYLLFERYFMEESVLKAIALDTFEQGQQCSSMVDDVFFIIRKSIRRSIATQSMNGICAVINNAASCFEGDFISALKGPLKNGYPSGYIDLAQAYNAIQSSIQQGKLQTNDAEQARTNFIVQLNNADMSTEYIETLSQTMIEEINGTFPNMVKRESELLESCMSGLKGVKDSLKTVVDYGMQQLKSSAIKPRLNPWVDQFLTYNHRLTEEELAAYEAGETFAQFLIVQIDGLLNSFKSCLSPRNYDALVSILATEVTSRLERAIKKSTFNRLGGLVLDQEVRALGTYLTGATSWSVRDKMARLTQIATLLNLEKLSELAEYWNPDESSDMPAWRITPNEVRSILKLREDFRMEDVKRIKI